MTLTERLNAKKNEAKTKFVKVKIPEKDKEDFDFDINELDIDIHNLDGEVIKNAKMTSQIVRRIKLQYVIAKREEAKLIVLEDEISQEVRDDPTVWGIPEKQRLTDGLVNKTIKKDKRWTTQAEKTWESKAELGYLENLLKICQSRSYDLKTLTHLFEMEYFHTEGKLPKRYN